MTDKKTTISFFASGIGFIGILTIVFIVLKLIGVIGWSWLWVFVPLWGLIALVVGGIILFFVVVVVIAVVSVLFDRGKRRKGGRR